MAENPKSKLNDDVLKIKKRLRVIEENLKYIIILLLYINKFEFANCSETTKSKNNTHWSCNIKRF